MAKLEFAGKSIELDQDIAAEIGIWLYLIVNNATSSINKKLIKNQIKDISKIADLLMQTNCKS